MLNHLIHLTDLNVIKNNFRKPTVLRLMEVKIPKMVNLIR